MKKYSIIFGINLILTLLQVSFIGELGSVSYLPNIVVSFGTGLLMTKYVELGLWSLVMGGGFLDILNAQYLGMSSFILSLEGFIAISVGERFTTGNTLRLILLCLGIVIYLYFVNTLSWSSAILTCVFAFIFKIFVEKLA